MKIKRPKKQDVRSYHASKNLLEPSRKKRATPNTSQCCSEMAGGVLADGRPKNLSQNLSKNRSFECCYGRGTHRNGLPTIRTQALRKCASLTNILFQFLTLRLQFFMIRFQFLVSMIVCVGLGLHLLNSVARCGVEL